MIPKDSQSIPRREGASKIVDLSVFLTRTFDGIIRGEINDSIINEALLAEFRTHLGTVFQEVEDREKNVRTGIEEKIRTFINHKYDKQGVDFDRDFVWDKRGSKSHYIYRGNDPSFPVSRVIVRTKAPGSIYDKALLLSTDIEIKDLSGLLFVTNHPDSPKVDLFDTWALQDFGKLYASLRDEPEKWGLDPASVSGLDDKQLRDEFIRVFNKGKPQQNRKGRTAGAKAIEDFFKSILRFYADHHEEKNRQTNSEVANAFEGMFGHQLIRLGAFPYLVPNKNPDKEIGFTHISVDYNNKFHSGPDIKCELLRFGMGLEDKVLEATARGGKDPISDYEMRNSQAASNLFDQLKDENIVNIDEYSSNILKGLIGKSFESKVSKAIKYFAYTSSDGKTVISLRRNDTNLILSSSEVLSSDEQKGQFLEKCIDFIKISFAEKYFIGARKEIENRPKKGRVLPGQLRSLAHNLVALSGQVEDYETVFNPDSGNIKDYEKYMKIILNEDPRFKFLVASKFKNYDNDPAASGYRGIQGVLLGDIEVRLKGMCDICDSEFKGVGAYPHDDYVAFKQNKLIKALEDFFVGKIRGNTTQERLEWIAKEVGAGRRKTNKLMKADHDWIEKTTKTRVASTIPLFKSYMDQFRNEVFLFYDQKLDLDYNTLLQSASGLGKEEVIRGIHGLVNLYDNYREEVPGKIRRYPSQLTEILKMYVSGKGLTHARLQETKEIISHFHRYNLDLDEKSVEMHAKTEYVAGLISKLEEKSYLKKAASIENRLLGIGILRVIDIMMADDDLKEYESYKTIQKRFESLKRRRTITSDVEGAPYILGSIALDTLMKHYDRFTGGGKFFRGLDPVANDLGLDEDILGLYGSMTSLLQEKSAVDILISEVKKNFDALIPNQ